MGIKMLKYGLTRYLDNVIFVFFLFMGPTQYIYLDLEKVKIGTVMKKNMFFPAFHQYIFQFNRSKLF